MGSTYPAFSCNILKLHVGPERGVGACLRDKMLLHCTYDAEMFFFQLWREFVEGDDPAETGFETWCDMKPKITQLATKEAESRSTISTLQREKKQELEAYGPGQISICVRMSSVELVAGFWLGVDIGSQVPWTTTHSYPYAVYIK